MGLWRIRQWVFEKCVLYYRELISGIRSRKKRRRNFRSYNRSEFLDAHFVKVVKIKGLFFPFNVR